MSTDAPETTTYQFPPAQRRSLLVGLRPAQVVTIAVAGVAVFTVLRNAGSSAFGTLASLAILVAAGAVAFVSVRGRPLDEWVPAVWRWVAGARSWRSHTPELGLVDGDGKAVPPPPLRGVSLLEASLDDGRALGVAKDRNTGTYTAVLRVEGGAFALADRAEQDRHLGAWAAVLGSVAREASPIHRVQWLERTRPEVGEPLVAYMHEFADPDVDEATAASYEELVAKAGSTTHTAYVAMCVAARRASRAIRQAGGGDRGAVTLLAREAAYVEAQLVGAELSVRGPLCGAALAAVIRECFDPTVVAATAAGVPARSAWPVATEASWGRYHTDGAWHTTYWIAQWPRTPVRADFLAPLLLEGGAIRTLSVTMEPIPTSRAARTVEHMQTARLADEELRDRAGYRPTARRRREQAAFDRREEELAEGEASFRFSGYVTVSAESADALARACGQLEQVASKARLEVRRLWGEQDIAFAATLPLCRGLR